MREGTVNEPSRREVPVPPEPPSEEKRGWGPADAYDETHYAPSISHVLVHQCLVSKWPRSLYPRDAGHCL